MVIPFSSILLTFSAKKYCWQSVIFVGPLITLFRTASDVCPWFQSQGAFPPMHDGYLRLTFGVTTDCQWQTPRDKFTICTLFFSQLQRQVVVSGKALVIARNLKRGVWIKQRIKTSVRKGCQKT